MPVTRTGTELLLPRPSPSCPSSPRPQHQTVPLDCKAQLKSPPALMSAALVKPDTRTGEGAALVVPSPNLPPSLAPQQRAVPSPKSAHVCSHPDEMIGLGLILERPTTLAGVA